jgi:hypothetical protein
MTIMELLFPKEELRFERDSLEMILEYQGRLDRARLEVDSEAGKAHPVRFTTGIPGRYESNGKEIIKVHNN